MIALLTLLVTLPAAWAGEQRLTYDLQVNGALVGTREVTIRYFERPSGERRTVESVTKVKFAGQDLLCRAVGQSSTKSANFSSQTELNGRLAQYQGVQGIGDEWRITLIGTGSLRELSYKPADGLVSTLDLVDPGRTDVLGNVGKATLFFVETGDVVNGLLAEGEDITVQVAGRQVAAHRTTFTPTAGGTATFDVDENGILLRSETQWLGVTVTASLHTLPPPRDFGTIDTIEGMGVTERPL